MSVKRGRRPLVLRGGQRHLVGRTGQPLQIRGNARSGSQSHRSANGEQTKPGQRADVRPHRKTGHRLPRKGQQESGQLLSEYGRVGLQVKTSGNGVRDCSEQYFFSRRWTPRYKCPIVYLTLRTTS